MAQRCSVFRKFAYWKEHIPGGYGTVNIEKAFFFNDHKSAVKERIVGLLHRVPCKIEDHREDHIAGPFDGFCHFSIILGRLAEYDIQHDHLRPHSVNTVDHRCDLVAVPRPSSDLFKTFVIYTYYNDLRRCLRFAPQLVPEVIYQHLKTLKGSKTDKCKCDKDYRYRDADVVYDVSALLFHTLSIINKMSISQA